MRPDPARASAIALPTGPAPTTTCRSVVLLTDVPSLTATSWGICALTRERCSRLYSAHTPEACQEHRSLLLLALLFRGTISRMASQTDQERAGPQSVPRTARARARAEITGEILAAGRRHLATDGAAGLSLRAIARDLGMASSAVYRYVASRDDLLTRLIIDAYDALGETAEAAEAAVGRGDLGGRWAVICRAVRDWALANPNEYALI